MLQRISYQKHKGVERLLLCRRAGPQRHRQLRQECPDIRPRRCIRGAGPQKRRKLRRPFPIGAFSTPQKTSLPRSLDQRPFPISPSLIAHRQRGMVEPPYTPCPQSSGRILMLVRFKTFVLLLSRHFSRLTRRVHSVRLMLTGLRPHGPRLISHTAPTCGHEPPAQSLPRRICILLTYRCQILFCQYDAGSRMAKFAHPQKPEYFVPKRGRLGRRKRLLRQNLLPLWKRHHLPFLFHRIFGLASHDSSRALAGQKSTS